MANIRANEKNGKVVSYRFIICLERDTQGKQIRRYTTWTPPEGLTPTKAKKAAERAADAWEQEVKAEYQKAKAAAVKSFQKAKKLTVDGCVGLQTWTALLGKNL